MDMISKDFARTLLKLKILESDGSSFETLFTRIMSHSNSNFRQVKPQGHFGDGKNDGYIESDGIYYQVYSPESLQNNTAYAVKKFNESVQELVVLWPVKEVYFVLNDKYRGALYEIHQCIIKTSAEYKISCKIFAAKDLEDVFMKLDEIAQIDIVGPYSYIFEQISRSLKFSDLDTVIKHIMQSEHVMENEETLIPPLFEEKVAFNNLGLNNSCKLNTGYLQVGVLEQYFNNSSEYVRERLRVYISALYYRSKDIVDDSVENYSDLRFSYILKQVMPESKSLYLLPCYSIMSYYFETCDIFEPPIQDGDLYVNA